MQPEQLDPADVLLLQEYRDVRAGIREELIAIAESYARRIGMESERAGAKVSQFQVDALTLTLRTHLSMLPVTSYEEFKDARAKGKPA